MLMRWDMIGLMWKKSARILSRIMDAFRTAGDNGPFSHRTGIAMDAPDDEKMARIMLGVQRLTASLSHLVNWMSGVSARPGQATAMLLARARYAGERYVCDNGMGPELRGKLLDLLETVRELDACHGSLAARSGSDIERYLSMTSSAQLTLAEIIDDLGCVQEASV
jgi:hypothetical protein